MIAIAEENARRAGVADTITFSTQPLSELVCIDGGHLVTNPPYGKRLESDDLDTLYRDLEDLFLTYHLTGGVITTYDDFPHHTSLWSKMNLMNGGDQCQFWRKTSAKAKSTKQKE